MPHTLSPTEAQISARPGLLRWGIALAIGVVVGAAVLGLRLTPVLRGPGGIVLLVLLWLLAPLGATFARRFAVGGLLTFGLLWLTYTAPDIYGSLGRGTVLLCVAATVVTVILVLRGRVTGLPRVGWADAVPMVAIGVGAAFYHLWLRASDGYEAMTVFRRGWDFGSHFDMPEMLRVHGQTINLLPASPQGGDWGFATYPQGFHAMVAFIMELLGSPQVGTPSSEIATFAQALAVVWILVSAMVVAALLGMAALRARPVAAAVLSTLACGALLWGPGASLLYQGLVNLAVGCGLVMAAMAVAISTRDKLEPIALIAVTATVMCAAQVWAPLAVAAAPAAALILLPARRPRYSGKGVRWLLMACVLAVVATAGYTWSILASGVFDEIVGVGPGGVALWSLGLLAACGLGCVAGGLALTARLRSGESGPSRRGEAIRTAASCLVPVITITVAALFAIVQFRQISVVGYYTFKMLFIVELTAIISICALVPTLLPVQSAGPAANPTANAVTARPSHRRGRWLRAGAAVIAVLAASQVYGIIMPAQERLGLSGLPGATWQDPFNQALNGPAPEVYADLMSAVDAAVSDPGPAAFVDDDASGAAYPGNLAQWFSAALGDWNDRSSEVHHLYPVQATMSPTEAADVAEQLIEMDPELTVYTNDRVAALVLQSDPSLADRIHVY